MTSETIVFSVIIPTYNRPKSLGACLQSLTQQNYSRDYFEVIIIDDGSDTPLDSIVTPFEQQLNLTLLRQSNQGPAKARNTGATKAKGKFVVFTDDDCTPAQNWLTAFEKGFLNIPDKLLGGKTINGFSDNLYSTASHLIIQYLYSYYNVIPSQAHFFTSNNFALPTKLFHELGGFDVTFPLAAGEDREFCQRWRQQGYSMEYVSDATVFHFQYLTLQGFWQQQFNYGRGAFQFHLISARTGIIKASFEPLSFYFSLLVYPFFQASILQGTKLFFLLILSQIANIAGFFWEQMKQIESLASSG